MSCLNAALILPYQTQPSNRTRNKTRQYFHSLFSAPQKEWILWVPFTPEVLYWFHKTAHTHTHTHTHAHTQICVSVDTMQHHKHENKYGRLSISTHMARSNNRVSFIQNKNKVVWTGFSGQYDHPHCYIKCINHLQHEHTIAKQPDIWPWLYV